MSTNLFSFFFLMQKGAKIPKVNRQILDSLIEEEMNADTENADKSSKKKKERKLKGYRDLLEDERFKEMFENKVGTLLAVLSHCMAYFYLGVVYEKKIQYIIHPFTLIFYLIICFP